VIAITAMILPGISGSYLLLIMRKYDFVLSNIGKLGGPETMVGFWALLPFIIGAVVGLALFSRVLSWLLARYHRATLSVLIGFLLGSLLVIWPFQDREYIEQVREVEVMLADDPTVQDLLGIGDDAPALPEYKRVVPAPMESSLESSLVDQEPSTQESKEGTPEGEVFVETVKRKLISSTPYWPDATNEPNRWMGFTSILMGLLLVAGLERLR
jgi:putative membrane protein